MKGDDQCDSPRCPTDATSIVFKVSGSAAQRPGHVPTWCSRLAGATVPLNSVGQVAYGYTLLA